MSPASSDSLSLSQARSYHPGDDAGGTSPRRTGGGRHSDTAALEVMTDSIHSHIGSPMVTPTSTKEIVDGVAEISVDGHDLAEPPDETKRHSVTIADGLDLKMPPPCRQSPTEVRVHVDYGSSLAHFDPVSAEGGHVKLGNSIVIGTGGSSRRGRSTSWRHGEGDL